MVRIKAVKRNSFRDHVLGLILNKIKDPIDRTSFSEVCRAWLRVEGLHRSSICLLESEYLRKVLPRFPNLVKFETSRPIKDCDLEFLAQTCPRLEFIDLHHFHSCGHSTDFVGSGLLAVAKGCPNLAKVNLQCRRFINPLFHVRFYLASNLTHLDLAYCTGGVWDEVVEAIASSHSIIELNLTANDLLTDRAIVYLANGNCSKSLKTLILDWVHQLTDVGVINLQKMHCLENLSLATDEKSGHLSDSTGVAISAITTLKKLSLKGLHKLSDRTIVALAQNCPHVKFLDLFNCDGITGAGIRAFSGHPCLETICLPPRNVSGSDVDHLELGCPSLKSIVIDSYQLWPLWARMQESTRKLVDHRPVERTILDPNSSRMLPFSGFLF